MQDMSDKLNNTIQMTGESERIGILDFYESFQILVRLVAAMKGTAEELELLHKPDNGMLTTCLEICTYKHILAELKTLKGENSQFMSPIPGMTCIEDDSILGNPDKMLFYTKEFLAAVED